jgi:methyl-accepting chemotaxis protein
MAGTLDKVAKELAKISKTIGSSYKNIDKDVGKLVEKLGEAAGGKAGGGGGGGDSGDMEAKVKKVQDQMKQMADLSSEIQKSVTEITKNMK